MNTFNKWATIALLAAGLETGTATAYAADNHDSSHEDGGTEHTH